MSLRRPVIAVAEVMFGALERHIGNLLRVQSKPRTSASRYCSPTRNFAPCDCTKSRIMPIRCSVGSGTATDRIRDQHIGRHEHANDPRILRKPVVGEIQMPRPRHRNAPEFAAASRHGEVGLVRAIAARVRGVVLAVVVDAHHQHHDIRLDARPQPLQQQVLLVGAVGRHARIDDAVLGHPGAQQVGEALVLLRRRSPTRTSRRRTRWSVSASAPVRCRAARGCCAAPEWCAGR